MEAYIYGAVMGTYREIQIETYMHAGMQTGTHADKAIHADTDIDTYIYGRQLQSDRQADTASQTDTCTQIHSETCRYWQRVHIQATRCRN